MKPKFATRNATVSDIDEIATLCASAFTDESMMRWVLPESSARMDQLRMMFAAALTEAPADSVIVATSGGDFLVGASIWYPRPGEPEPLDANAGDDPISRRLRLVQEATDARMPDAPHLYLPSMAAHPLHRRQGAASLMLEAGLGRAHELRLPVYLEASSDENHSLYAHHGFRDLGAPIRVSDGAPSLQPMWFEV